jgi:hypothetical protein
MALGLSRTEAKIATNGPGALRTLATTCDDLGEVFEPVRSGGYKEL